MSRGPGAILIAALAFGLHAALAVFTAPAAGQILQKELPEPAQGVGVDEKLGSYVPMDVEMTEADGRTVRLERYFNTGKPVVLALVYYNCPLICPLTLDRLTEAFNGIDFDIGEEYNVVALSFNPAESRTHAIEHKTLQTAGYRGGPTPEIETGWGFHTADAAAIARVADAVGYRYKRLDNGEYSHPLATVVLSPEGKITRYLYGLEFPPEQLKYSLLEASDGAIAESLGDVLAFQCFRYDPSLGKYTASAMAIMRIAGIATLLFLTVLIGGLLIGERVRRGRRSRDGGRPGGPTPAATSAGAQP